MKNLKVWSLAGIATAIMSACSDNIKTVENSGLITGTIPSIDTAIQEEPVARISADFEKLLTMFEEKRELPITIDEKFIEKIKSADVFKKKEIEMLTANYLKHDLCLETEWAIKHFYVIDSVKKNGTYDDWVNTLDLGQIKNSEATPLFKISSGNIVYLFWLFNYSTVEACPYSWTKSVYLTVVDNKLPGETIVFAENSGGGDAPISSEKTISGTLNQDQSIRIKVYEEVDQDEPKIEVTESFYELNIKDGKFVFVKEDKRPMKKVKKKK